MVYIFGEEEGENKRRTMAFKIRDDIYLRSKELLTEDEYRKFISYTKSFEKGSEKPASYFTDKDSEFKGWYGV